MRPVGFPQCNKVLKAPPGSEGLVQDLPICQAQTPNGIPQMVTAWELTMEERLKLLSTGILWVSFLGTTIPPTLPQVDDPFEPIIST